MSARPDAEACPNCGAPLDPDAGGQCRSCHVQHLSAAAGRPSGHHTRRSSAHDAIPFGLVPPHLNYGGLAEFIYLTLSALNMLGGETSVQQYTQVEPDVHRAILALSRAVAEAGFRVRDTNRKGNVLDEHLRLFTAEEIWMVDLAIDVVAMLATRGGTSSDTHVTVLEHLRSVDENVHSLHWKAKVHKAGDGPPAFRELRAHIPHHKPRA